MGFELPDGKTARNIQEQVAFLTEKVKELFAAVSDLGFKVITVEELPEEGAARTIYLVPSDNPETENAYDEYIWTEDGWEKVGSTDIDLSNYATLDGNNEFSGENTFTQDITTQGKIVVGAAGYNIKKSGSNMVFEADGNPLKARGDFLPNSTATYNLGNASLSWKDLYLSGNAYFDNGKEAQFTAINASHHFYIKASGNTFNIGAVGIATSLVLDTYLTKFAPAGNAQDLGASNALWRDLYISGELKDGTNSATVADIAALITYAKAQGWIS